MSSSRGRWLAVLAWMAVIELLTSWPHMPDVGAPAGTDKVVHFTMYAILGALLMRAIGARDRQGKPRRIVFIVLMTLGAIGVYAALDEWHQQFIPTRSMDRADWVADVIGGLGGILLVAVPSLTLGVPKRRNSLS